MNRRNSSPTAERGGIPEDADLSGMIDEMFINLPIARQRQKLHAATGDGRFLTMPEPELQRYIETQINELWRQERALGTRQNRRELRPSSTSHDANASVNAPRTVPTIDRYGRLHQILHNQLPEALRSGHTIVMPMTHPDGRHGYVPITDIHAACADGYRQGHESAGDGNTQRANSGNRVNNCSEVPEHPPFADIYGNIYQSETMNNISPAPIGTPFKYLWFRNQVHNKGPWDYKQQGKSLGDRGNNLETSPYQDFGNFNYGATGSAAGIPLEVLLEEAGRAQRIAHTSKPEWDHRLSRPYGDDPDDEKQIINGFNYYKYGCWKK